MGETETRMFELKVGIFIAVGILIFFVIIFSIGDVNLIKHGYRVNILFNFASGLTAGSPVRLAGVNVGQVEKINLFFDEKEEKTRVNILAWIRDENIKIEKDSRVFINTLGLLGEKYIEIFPGAKKGLFMADGDVITGHDPIPTEALTEKINELTDSANVVVKRMRDGDGTIGKFLVDEKIYNNLEALTEDIKKHPWKLLNKPKRGGR